jgi:hypothetical protein
VREARDDSEIKVYLHEGIKIEEIQRLLLSLRKTAVHYNLKYTVRKFGRKITPKDFAYQAEIEKGRVKESDLGGSMDTVMEKMSGYSKTSYQPIGDCRLVVRHSQPVDDKKIGARGRNIHAVYIENKLGERFLMPQAHLNGGRAMARHLAEGGAVDDDCGSRIKKMMTEWANLRGIAKYISENIKVLGDNDNTRRLREMVRERIIEINETFKSMSGSRGYGSARESLVEGDDVDSSVVATESSHIKSLLCLEEGNEAFHEGIDALARYSARKKAAEGATDVVAPINEPTVGDVVGGLDEYGQFTEWLNQFDPDRFLTEGDTANDPESNDDQFDEGSLVTLVPTPDINRGVFPEANWITKPSTRVTLKEPVERGTLDVVECELEDGTVKKIYGFNIAAKVKENPDEVTVSVNKPDTVWEAAATLVKWRSHPDVLREISESISDEQLAAVLETIGTMWMPNVADEIRRVVMEGRQVKQKIETEWDELTTLAEIVEDTRPTQIGFKTAADLIVSTRRLQTVNVNFDADYETLVLEFHDADACVNAARLLKEYRIPFNEDVMGGDMGDDFIADVSPKYRRQRDANRPNFTGFPYEVKEYDVDAMISRLDDAGIDFSVDDCTFYFQSEEDKKAAIELHHPNDIDRGIVGEMSSFRDKVIQLSDYRK